MRARTCTTCGELEWNVLARRHAAMYAPRAQKIEDAMLYAPARRALQSAAAAGSAGATATATPCRRRHAAAGAGIAALSLPECRIRTTHATY